MERQTQAPKVVINASVFLTAVLVDEPADARHGAHRLLQDVITHQADAFLPDRFEDEVLGGLVEAVTKGRPILATPAAIFSALQRFMEVVTIHHRNADWQAEEVFAAALRWRVSYYDALYLVIAQKVGATYWTADRKLLRFLRQHRFPDLPALDWIGDYR
jgi:predicted nucleic acid-binding protein